MPGFLHEHQRNDRDKYIELVVAGKDPNICKTNSYRKFDTSKTQYTTYDYCSIMHYDALGVVLHGTDACQMAIIGKNNKNPVDCMIKGKHVTKVGESIGLSDGDIKGINEAYGCDGKLQL